MEMVTNEIEKTLFNNCDELMCETEAINNHFIKKYSKRNIKYTIYK